MSMWSKLKVTLLTAMTAGAVLYASGCLGFGGLLNWNRILEYVAIGSIFD